MDRTRDFRDMVTDLRRANGSGTRSSDVMRPITVTRAFTRAANEMMTSIDGMQRHIITAQADYLNLNKHLSSSSSMTDEDRDRLEAEVDLFGKGVTSQIEVLKSNIIRQQSSHMSDNDIVVNTQLWTHEHTIIICLLGRLSRVTNSMQLLRQQRTQQIREEAERLHPAAFRAAPALTQAVEPAAGEVQDRPDLRFTEAEQLLYESENAQLLDGLEDHLDQLQRSEQRIHEIGQLLSVFQDKVEEQEHTIATILDHAVRARISIIKGRVEVEKPTKRSSTFRTLVLFILVSASFSLLFLDWVTP